MSRSSGQDVSPGNRLGAPWHPYVIAQSLHPTRQSSLIWLGIRLGISDQARAVIRLNGERAVLSEPFRKRLLLVHDHRLPRPTMTREELSPCDQPPSFFFGRHPVDQASHDFSPRLWVKLGLPSQSFDVRGVSADGA